MRKLSTFVFAAATAAVLTSERPCDALTADDLAGTSWSASYATTLRVAGVGRRTSSTTGTVTFSEGGTFSATEDDGGTMRTYSGTWRLTNRGRRLRCRMDSAGRAELKAALTDWIYAEANDGEPPELTDLSVRLTRVNFRPARVGESPAAFTVRLGSTAVGSGRFGRRRIAGAAVHSARIDLTPQ